MRKQRVYLDTSVIGGCFDPEFEVWSNGLINDFRTGKFLLVLSDVTAAEIEHSPEPVRKLHEELASISELLPVTKEALLVLAAYERRNIMFDTHIKPKVYKSLKQEGVRNLPKSWEKSIFMQAFEASQAAKKKKLNKKL